jgi:hypothetical protein
MEILSLFIRAIRTTIGQSRSFPRGFFTTDFTDFTDGKWILLIREIREIRGCIPLVSARRAGRLSSLLSDDLYGAVCGITLWSISFFNLGRMTNWQ